MEAGWTMEILFSHAYFRESEERCHPFNREIFMSGGDFVCRLPTLNLVFSGWSQEHPLNKYFSLQCNVMYPYSTRVVTEGKLEKYVLKRGDPGLAEDPRGFLAPPFPNFRNLS